MWRLLRVHYGSRYPVSPTQITRSRYSEYLGLSADRDRDRLFPPVRIPGAASLRRVAHILDHPERRSIWIPRSLDPSRTELPLVRRDFRFPSPHTALTADFAAQLASTPENGRVHGRLYHVEGTSPRTALIAVHGFATDNLDSMARFLPLEWMARRHVLGVALSLPYHGLRRPARSRFSGEYLLSGDLVRTLEGTLQAVADLRTTMHWLRRDHGIERIAVIGGSLGGYLATLTAAVEPEIDLLFAIAPPVRVLDSVDHVSLGRHARAGLRLQAIPPEVIEKLQDLVDPSQMVPAMPLDRMHFIAGRNDLFVPRMHLERLASRWQGIRVRWNPLGHVTAFLAWPPARLFPELERCASAAGF